ncbi:CheR family methyltransferase, partial [Rhizobium phaseoli]
MLISLAEHAQERAIAVILRGLENDGTAGVAATKKFGGLAIAEIGENEEGSAEEGLGASAIADLRLPAQGIATHIALYAGNVTEEEDIGLEDEPPSGLEAQITQIATVLRNVTSHDFHGYKRGTFTRRVQRRMQVLQIGSIETYIERLRASRDEVQNLFQDLLIGVTQFFRDPGEFEALEREIPRLFEGKEPGDQLRVWVLGCATGEEAYSIAMLLREHMATMDYPPDVQIFATDLDARALGIARAGRYSAAITSQVQPERLARWFVREGDTFCVVKELREMCIFSPHNIVKDAPFSRIDILSC